MKLNILFTSVLCLFVTACQFGYRKPSSTTSEINLAKEVESIYADIQNENKFRLQTCAPYIKEVYQDVLALSPTRFEYKSAQENWKQTYNNLWQIRVKLREKLQEFSSQVPADNSELVSCMNEIRDGFRLSRWLEDYLAETFSGEPQDFKAGDPKAVADAKFKPTALRGESPWLMVNPKYGKMTIRSGDVIISRGNAYTSAAIARIGNIDSQFSHLAFIFVAGDGTGKEYTVEEAINNPKVLVIEAHIEVGSTIRPFREYLADGNARNVLFRYGDALIAHRSARWAYDYIQNYRKKSFDANPLYAADDVNHNVPYNFQMGLENPENPKKLFCTQVAYVGFKSNNVTIPLYMSAINPNLSLTKRLGVTTKQIFAPGDMEVDPRFEMIGEYRNLRKLKGLRMKDMALTGMFKMMDEGYEFTPLLPTAAKSVFAWTLRQMDMKFTKPQLPKNMNVKILNTTFTLEKVAKVLEIEIQNEETNFQKVSHGVPLSFAQGLEVVERVKNKDREAWIERKTSKFHDDFRPPQLQRQDPTFRQN